MSKKEDERLEELLEATNFEEYAMALHNYNTRSAQTARAEETVKQVISLVEDKKNSGGTEIELRGIFAITDVEPRLYDSLIRACRQNVDYHLDINSEWEEIELDTYRVSWEENK